MKRWAILIAALALALPSAEAWAQATGRIVGTVTNESGAPLSGATVGVDGTQLGARTGADGRFTINGVPAGSRTVRANMLGYGEATRIVTVAAGQDASANIVLRTAAITLEGVVAVGYGTQRAETLTGSVAAVRAEQIEAKPIARVTEALQGATPGLTVIQRSAQPGRQDIQFNVRGRGTLNSTTPLVLIDGVPGDINQMNPTDIESITILKDASSAAIYGSRAANGVVLVTTKRGRAAGGIQVQYDGYYGIQGVSNFPEVMGPRDYLNLINEAAANAGFTPRYTQEQIEGHVKTAEGAPDADPIKYPWTDWLDVLFDPAPIQEHTVGLSGGNELARFNLSFNYLDHEGMTPNTEADRLGARLNSDFDINERFTAGLDLALRRSTDLESNNQGDVFFRMLHDTPPTVMAKYPDGTYGWSRNNHNPLAYAEAWGTRDRAQLYGSANARADYELFDGFTIRTQASAQMTNGSYKDWRNQAEFRDYFNPSRVVKTINLNRLEERRDEAREIYLRALGEYERTFGDHELTAMVGYDQTQRDFSEIRAIREGFYANSLQEVNAGDASRDDNFGTSNSWRLRSGFGRLNYTLMGRYLFEANARYDGSSRFAKGNRFGFFPSFSLGWRLSEEPFFANNVGFFDDLKLRGSWGRMGNQDIGLYRYFPTIAFGHTYVFGSTLTTGAAQTQLANEDISWETTEMTNFGLDAAMLDSRLSLTADIYTKTTDGILLELPIPNVIGMGPPIQNAAVVNNKGWELGVNWADILPGEVSYSIGVNFWDNINKIVSLAGTGPYISFPFVTREGGSLGDMWGYESLGLFVDSAEVVAHAKQASPFTGPGDIKYKDQNGDGVINQDDRVVIGNDLPRYQLGSNLSAGWNGLDLSLFFQGVLKTERYQTGALVEGPVWENFTVKDYLDRWTYDNPNPNARYPKPALQRHHNLGEWTDFWVSDASYVKLKTAQLGYQLPASIADRLSASSIRVYVSGQNLITWSNTTILDPEAPSGRATVYPQTRTVSFGTSMRF